MRFHPLFKWLTDDPCDAGIGRVSRFASALGFDLQPCVSPGQYDGFSGGDADSVLASWAAISGERFKNPAWGPGYELAGGWFTGAGNAVAFFVRPKTQLAKALWLVGLAPDRATTQAGRPYLSDMVHAPSMIRVINKGIAGRLGEVPPAIDQANWPLFADALDVLLDGFQVSAIDPLASVAQLAAAPRL
jgi:hypothetical protein